MPVRQVAQFTIDYLQVLDEHGALDEALEPELDRDKLLYLYRSMVLARELDARMLKLQRQGRIGTFPPCTGHEASTCATALAMGERDWLVGSYREVGARLMRGEPPEHCLLYYNGYEEGSATAAEHRILPVTVILASQLPHAVGIAYAMRQLGEKETVVVSFMGDGATSQGDFHEALNFAATWKVPVVFVCQNNQWAISVPRSIQTASETIAQKAIAYGVKGIQVDGNDALAMYRAASEAIARAKAGEGPTLIEAVTYRLLMHTTADDPKKYRSEEEEKRWWQRDPIPRFRKYLEQKDLWNETRQEELEAEVKERVDQAVKAMESVGEVEVDTPFDHVFGTSHPSIEAQRKAFLKLAEQREVPRD
jgi:pyruvate dehydrogenase E1 component alpha subunit